MTNPETSPQPPTQASSLKPQASGLRTQASGRIAWFALGLAVAFSLAVRIRLAEVPLERDEGEYAYAGQLIRQGIPPYKLAYNMKLPGTYLALAGLMSVLGETTAGVHYGLAAINVITIVLLFQFARGLFDPFSAGAAALAYAVLSASPSVLGMAAHATHFVALFALAGAHVLWKFVRSGRPWLALGSGLLFGTALLMKQQGIFELAFGACFLIWVKLRGLRADHQPWNWPVIFALYFVGIMLPYSLTCVWLWNAGVWSRFIFWTIEYALQYVQTTPFDPVYFVQCSLESVGANFPLWCLAPVGAVSIWKAGKHSPRLRSFLFGFLAFSALCVIPGFHFRSHYYIVVLPAVATLIGVGCRALIGVGRELRKPGMASAIPSDPPPRSNANRPSGWRFQPVAGRLLVAATFALAVGLQANYFFVWTPGEVCRKIYRPNPFPECPEVARYIRDHTAPDEMFAVLGSEPELYFAAGRRSCTGYIYTYSLMEPQPLARRMQQEMMNEVESARPEYVVLVNVAMSWLPANDVTLIFHWIDRFLAADYRQVGVVDIDADGEAIYLWGNDAIGYKPRPDSSVLVFRRK